MNALLDGVSFQDIVNRSAPGVEDTIYTGFLKRQDERQQYEENQRLREEKQRQIAQQQAYEQQRLKMNQLQGGVQQQPMPMNPSAAGFVQQQPIQAPTNYGQLRAIEAEQEKQRQQADYMIKTLQPYLNTAMSNRNSKVLETISNMYRNSNNPYLIQTADALDETKFTDKGVEMTLDFSNPNVKNRFFKDNRAELMNMGINSPEELTSGKNKVTFEGDLSYPSGRVLTGIVADKSVITKPEVKSVRVGDKDVLYERSEDTGWKWQQIAEGKRAISANSGRWTGLIPTEEERKIAADALVAGLVKPDQLRTPNQIKQAAITYKNHPSLDQISAQAKAKAREELEKRGALLETFERNALDKLTTVVKPRFEALFARGGKDISPVLNQLANSWNSKLKGDQETVTAVAGLKEYLMEYVKVATGSTTNQASTDSARELVMTLLPAASTPEMFMNLISDQEKMMSATTNAYEKVKAKLKKSAVSQNPEKYAIKPKLSEWMIAAKKANPKPIDMSDSEYNKRLGEYYDKKYGGK